VASLELCFEQFPPGHRSGPAHVLDGVRYSITREIWMPSQDPPPVIVFPAAETVPSADARDALVDSNIKAISLDGEQDDRTSDR
jgi:hypothetical protein